MEYRSEIFDSLQTFFSETGFNDHQLHCEIVLGSPLSEETLRRAVALSLQAIPILATKYVPRSGRWVWESLLAVDLERAFIVAEDEAQFDSARTYRIDEELGPQLKVCLLNGKRNALAITMNHMITDGAGFKNFLYFFCDTYSRVLAEASYEPTAHIEGDRGIGRVMRAFGPVTRAAALLGLGGESNEEGRLVFPLEEGGETTPFIATRTIGREKVARLKDYCRQRGTNLNDAAIAAYYRALARRLGSPALDELEIPIMIDMRRYLGTKEFESLSNLSSMAITRVRQREGESFEETLLKAKAAMDKLKKGRIGVGGFVKLSLLFSLFGEARALRLLKGGLRNPLICMTNIGELDSLRLAFQGAVIESVYVCGSVKYKPHFQLALSGFAGTLTLSSNLYGTVEDRRRVDAFLSEVEEELSV